MRRDGDIVDLAGIEVVHPEVARILRAKSGVERLRLAHEAWELAGQRLSVFLTWRHPDWEPELHLRDIVGILRVSGGEIDSSFVAGWAERRGLGRLWQAVLKQAAGERRPCRRERRPRGPSDACWAGALHPGPPRATFTFTRPERTWPVS